MDENVIKTIANEVTKHFSSTKNIGLDQARNLSRKIIEKGKQMGVNAVVAITNRGANPVLIECSDHSFIASYDIALNKAYTVVALKMNTKKLASLAKPGGELYGIQFTNNGRIVIFGGGEPLMNKQGEIIGGLGVSGGSEEQDTLLASYGKEIFEKGI